MMTCFSFWGELFQTWSIMSSFKTSKLLSGLHGNGKCKKQLLINGFGMYWSCKARHVIFSTQVIAHTHTHTLSDCMRSLIEPLTPSNSPFSSCKSHVSGLQVTKRLFADSRWLAVTHIPFPHADKVL